MTAWLLVHSPLLGPASWAPVAAELWDRGDAVAVPDMRPALDGGHGHAQRQAGLAAEAVSHDRVVIAGHSGAGPLLPAVVAALDQRGIGVDRGVFVDAGLPHPGRSRRSTLPTELAAHLDELAAGGWLPPWPQWWPARALAELLPDAAARAALEADCPRLPAALFDDPLPAHTDLPPCGYVQLSDAYAEPRAHAAAAGWPVALMADNHLSLLTRPAVVAAAMRDVAADASALRNAARRHVARFNSAVRERDWSGLAGGFTEDATMRFTDVAVGPFEGRAAIEQAYRDQPPDDTMTIGRITERGPDCADVDFAWDAGGTGTMLLRWRDGLVARARDHLPLSRLGQRRLPQRAGGRMSQRRSGKRGDAGGESRVDHREHRLWDRIERRCVRVVEGRLPAARGERERLVMSGAHLAEQARVGHLLDAHQRAAERRRVVASARDCGSDRRGADLRPCRVVRVDLPINALYVQLLVPGQQGVQIVAPGEVTYVEQHGDEADHVAGRSVRAVAFLAVLRLRDRRSGQPGDRLLGRISGERHRPEVPQVVDERVLRRGRVLQCCGLRGGDRPDRALHDTEVRRHEALRIPAHRDDDSGGFGHDRDGSPCR
jgi:hypothetical protein